MNETQITTTTNEEGGITTVTSITVLPSEPKRPNQGLAPADRGNDSGKRVTFRDGTVYAISNSGAYVRITLRRCDERRYDEPGAHNNSVRRRILGRGNNGRR